MAEKKKINSKASQIETTGHTWDDDLQEYKNPIPTWWNIGFLITCLFAIIYWLLYPAWPIGNSYTKGVNGLNTITYTATTVDGKTIKKTTHWNTRAKYMETLNKQKAEEKKWVDKFTLMTYKEITADPELMRVVSSLGKMLFTEKCANCHQGGGQGKIGFSPNLTDDHWQYGGTYEHIETTITSGRRGYMPGFQRILEDTEITQLAYYVLSLSGQSYDTGQSDKGKSLFMSEKAACFYCHTDKATGRIELGSANLTDKIWLWIDVNKAKNREEKLALIQKVIKNGLSAGVMPVVRLTPAQIKLMTLYVHDVLGGGGE